MGPWFPTLSTEKIDRMGHGWAGAFPPIRPLKRIEWMGHRGL
jgi:hypothetical protein